MISNDKRQSVKKRKRKTETERERGEKERGRRAVKMAAKSAAVRNEPSAQVYAGVLRVVMAAQGQLKA